MTLLTDDETIRGMFMTSTLEIVRRLRDEKAVEAALHEAGIPKNDFAALGKYPLKQFMELQTACSNQIAEQLGGFEEGVARTGYACVEIFFESVAGRTMKLLSGRDPHKLMSAAPHGYSLAVSDKGKRSYQKTGPSSGVFTFVDDSVGPCHQIGTFDCAIRLTCEITPTITVEQPSLMEYRLLVSW